MIDEVKKLARKHNITAKYRRVWREWEIEGYHTDCHQDALNQVNYLIKRRSELSD